VDDIDRANEHAQKDLDAAIRAARGQPGPVRQSLAECMECGDRIPEARRAMGGVFRCFWCESRLESLRERGL
jgi:phage/conjugal plasmid C-4 type zinc finger TraR family protein